MAYAGANDYVVLASAGSAAGTDSLVASSSAAKQWIERLATAPPQTPDDHREDDQRQHDAAGVKGFADSACRDEQGRHDQQRIEQRSDQRGQAELGLEQTLLAIENGEHDVKPPSAAAKCGEYWVHQDNVDVRSTWVYSGLTRLSAGFGGVRRRDESGGTSDSSGATGNLDVAWAMSPKTQFSLAARRDVEPATTNFSTGTLVRGATLGANWAATSRRRSVTSSLPKRGRAHCPKSEP